MIKRFYILLLAIVASVGMMNAKVTWNSSNISDLNVSGTYQSYSKEGVTLGANSDFMDAYWQGYGNESMDGIYFNVHTTGGFTFSNTLGKNFTKIQMTINGPAGWDFANLGSGWSFYWDYTENPATVTWTGNASTVDLLKEASDFGGEQVKSIVFYFVGDSEAPDPTYTVALKAGTVNADKVTLSATSVVEGATVTVTSDEEYEITAFSAYYVVVNGQVGSINEIDATLNAETGAYSFTMPGYDVTIEATIALKPVPEGDIFAGFTATAGSGGFDNEGSANLVDNKFISSDWTKWCANDGHKSVPTGESESCWWIDFEASAALNPTGYILTTGNDTGSEHGRNPKNWVLKAKLNAGDAWTTIATVTNDVTMKNKSFKDYKFFVDQSGSYKYFRFEVFANQGASVMQLCQLRLIGTDAPAPAPTTWTSLSVGDVIKVGDKIEVPAEGDGSWGINGNVLRNTWGPYTLIRADIYQASDFDDPVVTELEDGAFYVLKAENSNFYPFSNVAKGGALVVTGTSDGLEVTAAENKEFTVAVHDGGGSSTPSWVLAGDVWDEDTKTLTVNSNPGYEAYYQNTQIEHLIISDGVTTIGESAFDECTALLSVVIGNDVTNIEANAFDECGAMTSLTIGNKVQTIGESAFGSCESLTSVIIPNSVTSIGNSAFNTCDQMSSLTIGSSVQTIGESAFKNCSMLTDVTIPASVESIGAWFFRNCENLATITCEATTPPTLGNNAFFDCDKLEHIYVPAASVATYKAADNWATKEAIISAAPVEPIPCTAEDLGKVLCTDGSIYATVSEATAASKTAAAVIAYVDTENGKALALALVDDGEMLWETAKTTAAAHTPAVSGGTWTLASKDDWNNMITAAGSYTALRDGFSAVGGTNMNEDAYWSSTPENDNAWIFYFAYGGKWVDGYVDDPSYVRACLAFDIPAAPAAPAYEAVMNLINEIPNPVVLTAECKAKIDAARAAYDDLSTADKDLVTNIATLTTAEAAFENVMNIWLSGDCDVILWNDTTLTVRKHAGEGNGAMADYNYMSRAPWYSSHWYDPQPSDIVIKSVTIEEGVTHLGDYAFAWMSEMKTATIPSSVTTIPEDAFYWSKAVDDIYLTVADTANLTWALPYSADAQFKPSKATLCHVPADLLTAYQEKFDALNMTFVGDLDPVDPAAGAAAIVDLINAIGTVEYTDECKAKIDAAREAYDKAVDAVKDLISADDLKKLTDAETEYADLKAAADQAEADKVIAKINNIPMPVELKLATRDSINNARAAYDALTADQKALVSNYQTLLDAEAALAALNPGGGAAPAGALNGAFSINADGDQIAFSKGNLQYQASTTTWRFATNQYDMIGADNANISDTYTGWIDLFGWGTGNNPAKKSTDDEDYSTFTDWGVNAISNGGNEANLWRTLTRYEWAYLIQTRTNAADLKGQATVADVHGFVLLPDSWTLPAGLSFTASPNNWTTNVYTAEQWAQMEAAGAVFLPATGYRNPDIIYVGEKGWYWSSDVLSANAAYDFEFTETNSRVFGSRHYFGQPVRLVAEGGGPAPLDSAQAVKDLIEAIPVPVTLDDACVDAIHAAQDAYNALAEATKGALDDATVQKLNQAITDYTALIQAGADEVIAKINNIPQPVTLKLATRDSIQNARAAYDALTADQQALVSNYAILEAAEATWATLNPGGGMPAGALSGKFTINADGDQIMFSKGNLQATTEDLGETWTWGFAVNQWDLIGNAAANNAVNGNGTVSANGTVDLFGWSTPTTYYGIHNSKNNDYYSSEFREWGENITGAEWKTLRPSDWIYIISNRADAAQKQGQATVNGVNGYIFLPDEWKLPTGLSFTAKPNNWTANVYEGDDWTAMENAGAVFLPKSPWRAGNTVTDLTAAYYWSSDNNNSYMAMAYSFQEDASIKGTGINRYAGIPVRLVTAGGASPTPLDSAQHVKDLIEAIPAEITLDAACVNAVQAARDAYNALSEAAQGALDAATVQKLTDAEAALTALNQAVADEVIAKINNIPQPVELKLATRDSIESARAAYDALTADQKLLVSNYQKLLDAEAALAEKNKGGSIPEDIVWDGNTGIENVSPTTTSPAYEGMTVTVGQGSSFSTYQSRLYFTFYSQPNGGYIFANENGTNITKVVIESTTALTSTMTEVDRMGSGWVISNENKTATWTGNTDSVSIWKGQSFTNYWVVDMITFTVNGTATPLDSAQAVKDLIDAIPTAVEYPTSGPAIAAALVAYQQLSDAAKGALDDADVQKMTDAAIQYAALDAIAAIEAIPAEIVYDPAVKAAIETAREKYDALIDASKALVDAEVVAKLTNAEQAWADLVALIEHTVTYIGKDGELKTEKVALLNIPNPAPDFNGHEFVRWDVKAGDFLEEGLRIKAVYTPIITTHPVAYDTLMYNGTAQTLIEAGVASDGHIEYRLNEGEWSAELPKADMAAAYVVDYKLVREGHEDYMAGSVTAVIAKAPVTYVAPQAYDTLTYNYNAQVLVTAGQTNDGTIEYSLDPNMLDSWSADLPQAMNAGTYAVYFRVQGDLNHFDSIAPAPVAVTIAKRDIVITAPVAYDTLVYNSLTQALAAAGSADFGTMEYTLTPDNTEGWSADMPQAVDAGTYAVYYRVQGDTNHNGFAASIAATVAKAQLTIMAEDKEVEYGESAPEFTVTFNGWQGQDDASVISDLKISSVYAAGSSVGTYAIVPGEASALNYAITYVNGALVVTKAVVSVSGAEAQTAKFADGHTGAEVLNAGTLNGIKLNDPLTHVTTAVFSSADVSEHLTITLFYELTGNAALLANYDLQSTSEVFTTEGVIIEPFLPNNTDDPEDKESKVQEGIEVYAYGYCEGDNVGLKYHLNSGNPDQYKIEFEDSRFADVDWTMLDEKGPDGVIYITVPVDVPTGDYKMTVAFRDSRFDWLESQPLNVTFHVNLPETYVRPLFDNTIVLVDTCECFTDIQWYHRADASEQWKPIEGANGHYLHVEGKLTGEYFVKAKMNGVETYTCEQTDMQTLYGADTNKQAKVKAYPNPVVSTTTVSIENSDSYEHSLRIVNLMGIEVKNTTFEGNETVVDMDSYTTGNYTISVDGIVVKVLKK